MSEKLAFDLEWESLDMGPPEERATFAAIGIRWNDLWLTEADDAFVKRVRQKVHLSAYRLAEWLAWNWWRLRWEPTKRSVGWAMAHRMSTIGGGYVWPNITIASDGERVAFLSEPTTSRPAEPLRYISQTIASVAASRYESAIDSLLAQVLGQLRAEGVRNTNCEEIWKQVVEERNDPEIARRRTLEALLGADPDEADEEQIERLVRDSLDLGASGVQELAAAELADAASEIQEISKTAGFETKPRDAVCLADKSRDALPRDTAAWRRGVAAAGALREQEKLGHAPISNKRLCELAGVDKAAITFPKRLGPVSFTLDHDFMTGSTVLRSGYETGRRFDLARLLGDRVASLTNGPFKPATRSYTYRQQLQRAFAGEFLCPFEELVNRLHGDFGENAVEETAEYYNVSEYTVRTLLINHGLLQRENLLDRFDAAA